jgi:hypothetical protein
LKENDLNAPDLLRCIRRYRPRASAAPPSCCPWDDAETNLITLCVECHGKAHGHIEWSNNNHRELTKRGLAAAKARGVKLGGPRLAEAGKRSLAARNAAADAFAANIRPIIKEIQASGVSSLRGVAKALNARGIRTARGGEWTGVQVNNVLER